MTLPFVMPDPFSFQRRVFAHYFPQFPLSIGDQPAAMGRQEVLRPRRYLPVL